MKIATSLFVAAIAASSSVSGFAPNRNFGSSSATISSSLNAADTLEGWKYDGVLKPTGNFILVKNAKDQEQSDGGILLSNAIQKTEGQVISTGSGKPHQESGILYPMPVEAGENVIYGQYDGTKFEMNGETHALIRDDDILVKFNTDSLNLDTVEVVSDNVLIHVLTKGEDQQTSGGLFLASTSKSDDQSRPSTGEVVKLGPGHMDAEGNFMSMSGLKQGDQVKFRDFAGNEVTIGKEEYSVVRVTDVLAKF
uniref:20 kDa chaperonin, chloroplastic n=1 Tax=Eucampia antarctica TaxID=49252 RepID=A0A7S2S697_9STRA|mmetsp:Transcript_3615/g.3413  ORF Transcript_3615/g.3413 Transcript_3615/m.3413 type:complete len:252 (+) Transcript_3615:85-840(+)|eukprot:CAMPEP_0197823184 /NCGR_PEP_ID=MMETSP1437-20131217/511_1 /TAXON_ID=49252 ORGANISM="Eucampia antarctica, Strain CCMP1452" /NCGR_SAMPLE_ID=MMETSP1437 /ASSEMBLY_ACC=CAM_ASM_001096 /LENGTH=251 /DNA_ID=CAMNT_0043422207 /DNA_START=62 /DNA_END=817 /DNA_ORIENTATION=+